MFYVKLEALRGIFALLIILAHTPFNVDSIPSQTGRNAYLIVDCFFMLSGWTMALAYQERILQGLSFFKYLYVRLARFYPLHIFVILIWGIYCYIEWPQYNIDFWSTYPKALLLNATLTHNIFPHHPVINIPAWTVSAEFFAYIVFFIGAKFIDKKQSLWFPSIIALLCYALLFCEPGVSISKEGLQGFYRCFGGFYLGVFIYRLGKIFNTPHFSGNKVELPLALLLTLSLTYGNQYSLAVATSLLCFALTIHICLQDKSGIIGLFLERPYLTWLGSISYSIYITHYLIIQLVIPHFNRWEEGFYAIGVNSLIILLTIITSIITHRLIEEPFRKKAKSLLKNLEA